MKVTQSNDQIRSALQRLLFASIFLLVVSGSAFSQTSNSDFERIKLNSTGYEYSGIALSPDGKTLVLSGKKLSPVQLVDWSARKVISEFNSGNGIYGSKVSYSETGKFILLKELSYADFSQNKDRSIDFEIVDAATGKQVRKLENVQDVVISADEQLAVCLNNDEVTFQSLVEGSTLRSIKIAGAANAIALNQNGKILAVSQMISADQVADRFRKNKKGLKAAVKYKQLISLYDAEKGAKIATIDELYDLVYDLSFAPGGELLFVFQTPEIRTQVANNKLSFINLIDAISKQPLRKGFTSMSVAQPELKISNNQKLFAINSKGNRFQEIHLYDAETGTLQKRFELGTRLFEKVDGEKMTSDSRPSFTFLPGDQSILIAMGNQLIIWNHELNP
ncbi:MAG: WD40 repeat domain-containing protein [Prolixibacteraceae bacterium]|nr:WD40 repeat domain-containing protein [Prolixibacteraceae bacterium]